MPEKFLSMKLLITFVLVTIAHTTQTRLGLAMSSRDSTFIDVLSLARGNLAAALKASSAFTDRGVVDGA